MPKEKVQSLTIYLMKEEFGGPAEILREPDRYDSCEFRFPDETLGVLFIKDVEAKRPEWLEFFEDACDDIEDLDIWNRYTAGVLLVQREGRTFALTFGHGRHLLRPGVEEPNFGLRVTLNSIDRDRIRAIDRKTLESVARLTREQTSRETGVEAFGLNVEQDLLRAVTATPTDAELGTRMTGRGSLAVAVPTTLSDLPDLLDRYFEQSESEQYREDFPWVDHLAEVRDPLQKERLDGRLVGAIRAENLDRIWLAPPEIVEWTDVAGYEFRPGKGKGRFTELTLRDYFEACRPPNQVTLDWLKSDRVGCWSAMDGTPRSIWTIYRCLHAELEDEDKTFVLSTGSWYQADPDFVGRIDDAIRGLPRCSATLPTCTVTKEPDFNRLMAEAQPETFALLDAKNIMHGGGQSKIELCDILTQDRVLIYVKRYHGSAPLSHLFMQGAVASRLLLYDREFRAKATERVPESHRHLLDGDLRGPDLEVAYVIMVPDTRTAPLPFFSRVSLKNTLDVLRPFRVNVSLTQVPYPANGN